MRFSTSALFLAASAAFSNAVAIPAKRDLLSEIESIETTLLADVDAILTALGVLAGTNSKTDDCDAWIGTGGEYTGEFINDSGENITLVVWGSAGSWVNVDAPLITYPIANGSSLNVSFATGASGAWAAIYSNTTLVNGQIAETWGEFTFDGTYSTFDVSREVNMDGRAMSIETEGCTSNMTTCVFQCLSGTSCWETYELSNCATGSQLGAEYGDYYGAPSGGCLVGSNNAVTVTFQS